MNETEESCWWHCPGSQLAQGSPWQENTENPHRANDPKANNRRANNRIPGMKHHAAKVPVRAPRILLPSDAQRAAARTPSAIIKNALVALSHIRAEVVELADTPSSRVGLAILYKLLIIILLPFASITSSDGPRNGQ
jgi:hypothetical protein